MWPSVDIACILGHDDDAIRARLRRGGEEARRPGCEEARRPGGQAGNYELSSLLYQATFGGDDRRRTTLGISYLGTHLTNRNGSSRQAQRESTNLRNPLLSPGLKIFSSSALEISFIRSLAIQLRRKKS